MKERKDWVDALRALAITLVVLGHQIPEVTAYFVVTSPIKMPLFFAISGYLFTKRATNDFYRKMFYSLIVPWFALGLLPYLLIIPIKGTEKVFFHMGQMLSGEAWWFMPCFIVGSIIFYHTIKIIRNALHGMLIAVVLAAIGWICYQLHFLDYAMINRALAVQPFFWLGYIYKKRHNVHRISDRGAWYWFSFLLLCYSLSIFLGFLLFPGECIDVHMCRYYSFTLCGLQIVLGLWMIAILSQQVRIPFWVVEIGKSSLLIYMWHDYVIFMVKCLSERFFEEFPHYVFVFVSCVAALAVCTLIFNEIRRYIPWMIGNRLCSSICSRTYVRLMQNWMI